MRSGYVHSAGLWDRTQLFHAVGDSVHGADDFDRSGGSADGVLSGDSDHPEDGGTAAGRDRLGDGDRPDLRHVPDDCEHLFRFLRSGDNREK